jgi:phosphoglycolate phosphatase-like HAD superfamily hydrolase
MTATSTVARFADVRAVLFDLDGTLVDSAPDLAGAVDSMRLKRGLTSLPLTVYRPMAGAGARGMLGVGFGIDPTHPDFGALREEFFIAYEQRLTMNTVVFDGVSALVKALVQHQIPWGVVTNKSERFTLPLTQALPLFASAATIISGDTTLLPNHTLNHCWRQHVGWASRQRTAFTLVMTNGTSWQARPLA